MAKLSVFNFITLNGYYQGPNGDITWHRHGAEESEYAKEGANSMNTLLFGRRTYEMMAMYWPSPMAMQQSPDIAQGMNASPKVLFSRSLKNAAWQNTRIVSADPAAEIIRMKKEGTNMTILGSGSIVTLCAEQGLIDEYKLMVDPVLIGGGTPLAGTLSRTVGLTLISTRAFSSGVVLLTYTLAV